MSYARNLARLAATGITTVATNQDLRDLVIYDGNYPQMAQTKGAETVGDHGGGLWRWQSDSVAVDDGLNVLLPTGQSASVPGRWLRQSDQTGIPVVETTQDLRDFTDYAEDKPTMVQTMGALSVGDGGGGLWRWDQDSLDADNFGVVLLPSDRDVSTPGRWLRQRDQGDIEAAWWGMVDGGVVDAAGAIQSAINYAESLSTGGTAGMGGTHVALPQGTYLVGSTLLISEGGISLGGPTGRGTNLKCSGSFLKVGPDDYTGYNIWGCTVSNIIAECTNSASVTSVGIRHRRTVECDIVNVELWAFYIGIDLVASLEPKISNCLTWGAGRSVAGLAAVRIGGVDHSDYTGVSATCSGGVHITDCEFFGKNDNTDATKYGILVLSTDGLYISNTHIVQNTVDFSIQPQATPENWVIASVFLSTVYFDGPSGPSGDCTSCEIVGKMAKDVTLANGAKKASVCVNINFSNVYFRCAGVADNAFNFSVENENEWETDPTARPIGPLIFNGCNFREARRSSVLISEASALAPGTLIFDGCMFDDWNKLQDSTSHGLSVHADALVITGCAFKNTPLTDPTLAPLWTLLVNNPTNSATIVGNDFSNANYNPSGLAIRFNETAIPQCVVVESNALPGVGKVARFEIKSTTTDAVTKFVKIYSIGPDEAGMVEASIIGVGPNGKTTSAHYRGGYRRVGSADALISSGTGAFVADYTWNPDTLPTTSVPTLQLPVSGGVDLRTYVTGVTGETWYWVASVRITEAP